MASGAAALGLEELGTLGMVDQLGCCPAGDRALQRQMFPVGVMTIRIRRRLMEETNAELLSWPAPRTVAIKLAAGAGPKRLADPP
jgi:hypothetical protein